VQLSIRAVGEIIERLPSDTLPILFADHGMRGVTAGGRRGNHGSLLPRDMFVPILLYHCTRDDRLK
jgi:hypothetical protein